MGYKAVKRGREGERRKEKGESKRKKFVQMNWVLLKCAGCD
jgi:hypothetical protein